MASSGVLGRTLCALGCDNAGVGVSGCVGMGVGGYVGMGVGGCVYK